MPRVLASALVVALFGTPLLLASSGCGSNACQELQERQAECLGADEPGGEEIPDEECSDELAEYNECLLDQSCDDLVNTGQAFVTCEPQS